MPLRRLIETCEDVDVQDTAFSTDAVGRYLCSSWEEATENGGPPFSAVIVGAGAYGAYLAAKLSRARPAARILLLDRGGFLVPEHVQNLGPVGLEIPAPMTPDTDMGFARQVVWQLPWRGEDEFPGLACCIGGRSLYWGGWCPRLTPGDLARWPDATAEYLAAHYVDVESETGVVPGADFIFGCLHDDLLPRVVDAAAATPGLEAGVGRYGVEIAPLAVQAASPVSGLFSFDKFSSVPLLLSAVRADRTRAGSRDAERNLFVVPRAHVVALHAANGVVDAVEVHVAGRRRRLDVPARCAVVLQASAIESTRLAMNSFRTPLMGRNLMVHTRSDFTFRLRRSAFPKLSDWTHTETAAMLIRGIADTGRFQLQLTASMSRAGSDELLFRMVPDLDHLTELRANADPDWLTVTIRAVGETHGDRSDATPERSWIDVHADDVDQFGVPRAYVHLAMSAEDCATWQAMDRAALTLIGHVVEDAAAVQYHYDDAWHDQPFPLEHPYPSWHRGLGSTHHEAGTLWMGEDDTTSVTDPTGRFHHVRNAYACDQSVFPTVGSVNPVLTGLTLAGRLAEHLTTCL
jgi:choline dehydrogenase-like flavoprotein